MTVRVWEITVGAETLAAIVSASSRERFRGRSLARIQIRLSLAALEGGSPRDTRERVGGEALRLLDVA